MASDRYSVMWFNRGRADASADLTPLPGRKPGTKAHKAYMAGYNHGTFDRRKRPPRESR